MVHCPVSELLEVITKVGVITTAVAKPWVCTERTAMPLLNITNKLGVGSTWLRTLSANDHGLHREEAMPLLNITNKLGVGSTWLRHQRMTTGCTEKKLCFY